MVTQGGCRGCHTPNWAGKWRIYVLSTRVSAKLAGMSLNNSLCPFLIRLADQSQIGDGINIYGIKVYQNPTDEISPGPFLQYLITSEAYDLLLRDANKTFPYQHRVDCAHRSLELWDTGTVALWGLRAGQDSLKRTVDDLNAAKKYNFPITLCILEDYLNLPVDHSAKPMDLLKAMARRVNQMGGAFWPIRLELQDSVRARIVARFELSRFVAHLCKRHYLESTKGLTLDELRRAGPDQIYQNPFRITVDGWAAVREAVEAESTNKVFIASAFKWTDADDAERIQAWDAIKRACKSAGYDADVVGQNHTGSITDEIIAAIRRSRFVIAELTYNNRGVYYEAGFARALGKPVFHVLREGHAGESQDDDREGRRIHFDIRQIQFRTWKTPDDLEKTLTDWIGAVVGHY